MTNFKNTNTRTYSHDNSVIPGCDITLIDVFKAYYDCRKHKRNTVNALDFEINLEKNIIRLYTDLVSGNYTISTSICFVVEHPKIREVWAANFRDRIVHHLIYNRYAQLFYNSFIHDSYACIPKKGTLAAAERVHHFCRATIQESTDTAYYLKADIANFFYVYR